MEKNPSSSNKKKTWAIVVLSVFLAVTIGVSVWALFFRNSNSAPVLAPDYAPQEEDKNAEPFEGDVEGEKLEQPQGGGAVNLTYSKEVGVDLSDRIIHLMFANPKRSNQNMIVQVKIQDTVAAQSGLITPGHQLTRLDLFDNISLSAGDYKGALVVLYYQNETGEKATLTTEIPVTINIKD